MRVSGYVVAAVLAAATSLAQPTASSAAGLQVGWISREPRAPPPNRRDTPTEEGWPDPGSTVHWVAHVLNPGAETAPGVSYVWRVDGEPADRGTVDLPPGTSTVWLPWRWTGGRHDIAFEIASGDGSAADDQLTVQSDALSLGFWVERALYDWMGEAPRPGFERWAQGQIEKWNRLLAGAVFDTAPAGALDRIRLDQVTVAADGARPRNDEFDTDLSFNFPSNPSIRSFLSLGAEPRVVEDQAIVLHELLHQRGLVYFRQGAEHGDLELRVKMHPY